ncbi:uracil-DNA glycosylase, partial [Streptococcus thermophilus]|nr:uracil-DNA glycosylase [Streptococcus thermophilus]
NSVLTVQNGVAFSHAGKGWERLTDVAIHRLSERSTPVVFILWGKAARSKIKLIDTQTNVVLQAPHPSPLSAYRGFFGSKPFSKTNIALTSFGEQPINWQLPEHVNLEH